MSVPKRPRGAGGAVPRAVIGVVAAAFVHGATASAPARADAVMLRSGETIFGTVEAMDSGSLALRRAVDRNAVRPAASDVPAAQVADRIGWDRIASIECEDGTGRWPDVERFLAAGERLWRARTRLERGDATLAGRAIEGSWTPMTADGPTAAVAAMVELQVALASRDQARAVAAHFEALRLRRRGFDAPSLVEWLEPAPNGAFVRRPVVDSSTPLCPLLPPFARSDEQRIEMLAALDHFDVRGDAELDELRLAFAAAVDPTRAAPEAPRSAARGADRGEEQDSQRTLDFLRALREARSADPAERRRGADAIAQMRRRLPEWSEAWGRFAVGCGLLLDATPESVVDAQLELLHLPARFSESQPFLAPLAASMAAQASVADGRVDEAPRIAPVQPPTEPR